MNILKTALIAALFSAAAAPAAFAAETSNTFQVRIQILESCDITTTKPTDIDFGNVTRTNAAVNLSATGTITVNCSAGTPYQIGLNGGSNSTGAAATPAAGERRMRQGATTNYVAYDLFQGTGSTFWGNVSGNRVAAVGNAAAQTHTVTARVTSVNVPAGAYVDTVTATVTY